MRYNIIHIRIRFENEIIQFPNRDIKDAMNIECVHLVSIKILWFWQTGELLQNRASSPDCWLPEPKENKMFAKLRFTAISLPKCQCFVETVIMWKMNLHVFDSIWHNVWIRIPLAMAAMEWISFQMLKSLFVLKIWIASIKCTHIELIARFILGDSGYSPQFKQNANAEEEMQEGGCVSYV